MTQPTPARVSAVIVLAAGQGTRMKSRLPKVMHPIAGRPLLWHALAAAADVRPERWSSCWATAARTSARYLDRDRPARRCARAVQAEQLGTGHAVACALAEVGARRPAPCS